MFAAHLGLSPPFFKPSASLTFVFFLPSVIKESIYKGRRERGDKIMGKRESEMTVYAPGK